ncbi:MAG TPA: hypothetical protein VHG51_16495 [Longimicrobiaceae bacterium]|nr:hypothetical protein [Longimicrobiaceae bacterium]
MRNDERNSERNDERGRTGADGEREARPIVRDRLIQEIEASETDGRGTGGMGADAGGFEPLPEE